MQMTDRHILDENRAYWSHRAPGYSQVNQSELAGQSRDRWSALLIEELKARFPERSPKDTQVLDVGTGPGFFAILLAEAGYEVTAVDLTPSMLAEARINAGSTADRIRFIEMNAESLDFPKASFDAVISRNLSWNLPHPEKAYGEWLRVLRPGGLLLNFDANWYRYLVDGDARSAYDADRRRTAELGIPDENVGENFDVMEEIARQIPLTRQQRPLWDRRILTELGFRVETEEAIWMRVWTEEEKTNFASTPLFLIRAVKEG